MATLTLTKVWFNRLDTGEAVSAQSAPQRSRSHGQAGEVRTYAGGRQRAFTTAGEQGQFEVTLRLLTASTVDVLRSWIGLPVQVRDHRGQRFFGVFFAVPVVEHLDNLNAYDVAIVVKTVTAVEGV